MRRPGPKGWAALSAAAFLLTAGAGFFEWPVAYFDGLTDSWLRLKGFRSQWITINGYRVHYLVKGPADGSPVLLLHGLGGRAQNWRALSPWFTKAGYRVYMPDLLGYGLSDKPRDFSYSVRDQAELVLSFMRLLGIERVDLGGWSMGGWIAQIIAHESPQLVRNLMLFASAGLHDRPRWSPDLFTPNTPAGLDRLNAILSPDPMPIPGFVARGILRATEPSAWIIDRAMAAMLSGRDVTNGMLPRLPMPVFLAWGANDDCIPLRQAELMHQLIPNSELHVIYDAGHLAPLECACQLGPRAVAFLKKAQANVRGSVESLPKAVQRLQPGAILGGSVLAYSDTAKVRESAPGNGVI